MDTVWYSVFQNDDAETFYVNEYTPIKGEGPSRETIADGLTETDADRLAALMTEAAAIIAKSTFADLDL